MADDHDHHGGLGFSLLSADGDLLSQCIGCAHYNGDQKCNAFPDGIPEAIFDDVIIHDVPIEGDHGLQWAAPTTLLPMGVEE